MSKAVLFEHFLCIGNILMYFLQSSFFSGKLTFVKEGREGRESDRDGDGVGWFKLQSSSPCELQQGKWCYLAVGILALTLEMAQTGLHFRQWEQYVHD